MSNTNTTFPINFELYDENEESVLFSTDNALGQTMTLDITNQSGQPIVIKKLGKKVSEQHHHFEFVFRPSTLFNSPSTIILQSSNFKMHVTKNNQQIVPNSDGSHSLYIAYTGTSQLTVNSTEKITIQLAQMRADAEGGTRGTRVMMKYQNLFHVDATDSFSGFREAKLNLVNHRGKRNIPLQVGFIGANTVLNDGDHANSLKLRLTNVSRRKVAIDNTAELSKLVLVAEGGPASEEWTLATDTELGGQNGMKVNVTYPNGQTTPAITDLGVNVWEFPFSRLEPGQYIDIALTNLITNHLTGHANLYLHYENIPGYWDGQFVSVVEKTPLVFKNKNVGIGTAEPVAALQINNQNQDANGNSLILGPTTQSNLRLGYDANYSWIQSHGSKPLAINPLGNDVGIGTTHPSGRLTVVPLANQDGVEVLSPSAGNTHLPHQNDWHYISGKGMQFRRFDENGYVHKMQFDFNQGNMAIWPEASRSGIDIFSPSAGNTHLPHANNWHYLSGAGVIFRHFANGQYAEKMRINFNNGNIGIGDLNPTARLAINAGSSNAIVAKNNRTGFVTIMAISEGNSKAMYAENKGVGYPAFLAVNKGDAAAVAGENNSQGFATIYAKNSHASGWDFWAGGNRHYGKSSSIRLKKDVSPIRNGLDKLLKLVGVRFKWKDSGVEDLGFIAEDAEKIIPEAVRLDKDGIVDGMSYDHVIPVLVEAVKEQQKMIERLKEQISSFLTQKDSGSNTRQE